MNGENRRGWRVSKPKLESIIGGMTRADDGIKIVRPSNEKGADIRRMDRGYSFGIPVDRTYADAGFLESSNEPREDISAFVYGFLRPNPSRSSWYIGGAGIYMKGEEMPDKLKEHNDKGRLLYSTDELHRMIETIGEKTGVKGITTEYIPEEHDFKKDSLSHLGYNELGDGRYFKRL